MRFGRGYHQLERIPIRERDYNSLGFGCGIEKLLLRNFDRKPLLGNVASRKNACSYVLTAGRSMKQPRSFQSEANGIRTVLDGACLSQIVFTRECEDSRPLRCGAGLEDDALLDANKSDAFHQPEAYLARCDVGGDGE